MTSVKNKRSSGTIRKQEKIRRAGRPVGQNQEQAIRVALLQAAREQFAQRDFKAVSIRQIATIVGVNPAMVHYYFGNKEGLYLAMLEASFAPLIAQLEVLQENEGGSSRDAMAEFLRSYMKTLLKEPWLPNLIVREILYQEGGLREQFIKLFGLKVDDLLLRLLEQRKQEGHRVLSLEPQLSALSLISMAAFPFIARPVVEQVFQLTLDEKWIEDMIRNILELYYPGSTVEKHNEH